MVVLLVRLGGPALWDDDEPKNAACSLAMLDSHDWVVPTFNGRLRVEKPPLVNWIQIAGFTLCGRNETGARIGSALLTVGTCLLTWQIGCRLLGPTCGLLGGLAMASCVWTAVGGRAATPDAPLLFFTTLAFFLFVRGAGIRAGDGRPSVGTPSLSLWSAIGIGAACGAATLAKGPVGLVLPLTAFLLFAAWRKQSCPQVGWTAALGGLRPLTIVLAAAVVALAPPEPHSSVRAPSRL
jgi:4-amino-4-deoxy-L-arabinose transferase-like glycosyltransferase